MENCLHLNNDGTTSIVFGNKWYGVEHKKYIGVCRNCKQKISFSREEYIKIVGGESIETDK